MPPWHGWKPTQGAGQVPAMCAISRYPKSRDERCPATCSRASVVSSGLGHLPRIPSPPWPGFTCAAVFEAYRQDLVHSFADVTLGLRAATRRGKGSMTRSTQQSRSSASWRTASCGLLFVVGIVAANVGCDPSVPGQASPQAPEPGVLQAPGGLDDPVPDHTLPATWRPFSHDSAWNTPIAADVEVHPQSRRIMQLVTALASNVRLVRS